MKILFVCTGNVCRSPVAERLAAAFFAELGMTDVQVASAGTHALVGAGIEPSAAAALVSLGGDPAGFRAQQVTPELLESADLVLTMTREQRRRVLALAPRALNRTFALLEAADLVGAADEPWVDGPCLVAELARRRTELAGRREAAGDVLDPMGRTAEVHGAVVDHIAVALFAVLQRLASAPLALSA